ncbi:MAG: substrate-binding domain-containing protein [Armatimonadota bacterium]|nr:substrate-binding domain-containing protein [Armatimonadota bacterium]
MKPTRPAAFARVALAATEALFLAAVLAGSGCTTNRSADAITADSSDAGAAAEELVIFHAEDLTRPFSALEAILERREPGLDVVRESGSSEMACRKVTDLGRRADVVAVTDYSLIDQMLIPDLTSWAVTFARNRIVLLYGEASRHHTEIGSDNWFEILLREDVTYGYADPSIAPVGYRTLLSFRLADIHHGGGDGRLYERLVRGCPETNIRPHCEQLFPMVQSGSLDYVFHYRSLAAQHHLQYVELAPQVDLSDPALADQYARASVEIPGGPGGRPETVTGRPIVYAITILDDAGNRQAAMGFLRLLLGSEGRKALEEHLLDLTQPNVTPGSERPPEELADLIDDTVS